MTDRSESWIGVDSSTILLPRLPLRRNEKRDPELTKKTSAASRAGQVKMPLPPPPTTCSQIQPAQGFRKSIHNYMLILTSSKKSWKSCPKAMPRTQTRIHMFILGLPQNALKLFDPFPPWVNQTSGLLFESSLILDRELACSKSHLEMLSQGDVALKATSEIG